MQTESLVEQAVKYAFDFYQNNANQDAEIVLKQVLRVSPEHFQANLLLGLVYFRLKKYKLALELLSKIHKENNSETCNNLSLCYAALGNFDKSIPLMEQAVKLNPLFPSFYSNLALQYRHIQQREKAETAFRKTLELKEDAPTWCMLAGLLAEQHRFPEAEECLNKSLSIDPNFAGSHVDLNSVYQTQGKWKEAWKEYEYRFQCFEHIKIWEDIYHPSQRWGGEPLNGRTIMLYSEQGFGDAIQFSRYIPVLKRTGIVKLHVSEGLRRILEPFADEFELRDPGIIQALKTNNSGSYDVHASLMSLPYLLGEEGVSGDSYLKIPEKVDLGNYSGFKIGILWAGNPGHPNDSCRSCYLKNFQRIHDLPGVKLFSLQKDLRKRVYQYHSEPIDLTAGADSMKIVDMSGQITDFWSTATILNSLDLIITVDTAVLHLAGAMGKPCWGLLPYNSDPRWGLGETTPWYNSVKLLRQPTWNDWESVFREVENQLKILLN